MTLLELKKDIVSRLLMQILQTLREYVFEQSLLKLAKDFGK